MKQQNLKLDHETIKSKALGVHEKADLSHGTIEKLASKVLMALPLE